MCTFRHCYFVIIYNISRVISKPIIQLTDDSVFVEECREKPLCVISVLPHILDTMAEGRNNMITMLKELGDKYKAKQWG